MQKPTHHRQRANERKVCSEGAVRARAGEAERDTVREGAPAAGGKVSGELLHVVENNGEDGKRRKKRETDH